VIRNTLDAQSAFPAAGVGPRRHFGEDLVLEHTVGAASEGAALAVACHLTLCGLCRALAHDLERIGETLLETQGAGRPRPELRARLLAADLGPPPACAAGEVPAALLGSLAPLPAPLVAVLAGLRRPRWRFMIPGVRAITLLEHDDGSVARLLRLRPGLVVPAHDHGGSEHTVVFAGGLDDQHVRLGRGDALTMEPGDTHEQLAAPGGDCLALVVNEAPPRPLTLRGRILKKLARL
jgi:putative transcriptional regulator